MSASLLTSDERPHLGRRTPCVSQDVGSAVCCRDPTHQWLTQGRSDFCFTCSCQRCAGRTSEARGFLSPNCCPPSRSPTRFTSPCTPPHSKRARAPPYPLRPVIAYNYTPPFCSFPWPVIWFHGHIQAAREVREWPAKISITMDEGEKRCWR